MAMYENKGYCPNNAFLHYGMDGNKKVSTMWDKVKDILGDRIGYMVYSENGFSYKECYIVDAIEGGEGSLGMEVAVTLQNLIPVCEYAKKGRPIICTDVINPHQIPVNIAETDKKWALCTDDEKTFLFEDERYLVAIQNNSEEVNIYLYKK